MFVTVYTMLIHFKLCCLHKRQLLHFNVFYCMDQRVMSFERCIIHIKIAPGLVITSRLGCSVQQYILKRKERVRKKPPVSGPNVSGSRRHESLVHLDPDRFRSQLDLLDRRLRSQIGLRVFNSSTYLRMQRICLVRQVPSQRTRPPPIVHGLQC